MQAPMDLARAEGADEVIFTVSASNARAIALYRRMGFEVTTSRWREWQEATVRQGAEQLVMRLVL